MIDISNRTYLKYLLFTSLYFSEGLQGTLTMVILPIYFLEKGLSLPLTTLVVGIAGIPWMIKFVYGGIVDNYIQYGRKRFILIGGFLMVVSLFTAAFVDPVVALIPLTFILFIARSGSALIDVSADAWAIEISNEKERGKINSAMFGGMFIGSAIGAPIFAIIAKIYGYDIVFLIAGLIIIPVLIFPLIVKEFKIAKKRQNITKLLVGEFKKRNTQLMAIFGPFIGISVGLLMIVVPLYAKVSLEFDIAQVGMITSVYPITTVVGASVCGPISDRWGRKGILYILLWAGIFFSALFVFANTWLILAVLYGIVGFFRGGYYVVTSAIFMDLTNPKVGATEFSILTSLANVGILGIGFIISGSMIEMFGFDRAFLFSAWFFGPALLILYLVNIKKPVKSA
jgi:MFS family permease